MSSELPGRCTTVAVVASGALLAAFGVSAMRQDADGRITVRTQDGAEFSTCRPDIPLTQIKTDADFVAALQRIRHQVTGRLE